MMPSAYPNRSDWMGAPVPVDLGDALFEDVEALREERLLDGERRLEAREPGDVVVDVVEAAAHRETGDARRRLEVALARLAVLDELDRQPQPHAAHFTDDRILLLHGAQPFEPVAPQLASVLERAVAFHDLERRDRGGAGSGVAGVGPRHEGVGGIDDARLSGHRGD